MEKQVVFRDNQELQADDFLNQQGWVQQSLDHVVNDTINIGRAYWGFGLTKTAQTTVKTTQGRLYSGGAVYVREDEVSIDLYNQLPVTARKIFAIVAWGQTVDEDIQPRNFLIDADTGMAEPQSVAMQRTRYCNVSTVAGTESADPQAPAVEATYTLIGTVLCDPTGIISVSQSVATQVDNLSLVAAGLRQMMAWRGVVDGALATLRTDLANLASQLLLYTPLSEFQKLVDIVAELWEIAHRPATYIYYGTDKFLDDSQSAVGANVDGLYNARIDEGLRFEGGGAGFKGKMQLLNPSEPVVESYEGFMLPKPSGSRVRYDCSFPGYAWTPVRLLSFGYWAFTCRQLTPARWRYRCGPHFLPSPPAQVWWYQAQLDPTYHILSFADETWEQTEWGEIVVHNEVASVYWPRHGWDRWNYYWRDWVDVNYWAKVYNDFSHSGNHAAQSFYNAQDGWLSGITVFSHRKFYQPLSLVITGCTEDGTPDHENHTLRRVILDVTAIQTCYGAPITVGDILPQFYQLQRWTGGTAASQEQFFDLAGNPLSYQQVQDLYLGGAETVSSEQVWTKTVTPSSGDDPGSYDVMRLFTVSGGSMPANVFPLRINFPPVFLQAGRHYAFHVHSTFDHEFSFCDHDAAYQVHQGAFWRHDGTRFTRWGPGPRTFRFLAHFATWGRWGNQQSPGGQLRYEINMQPLQLAGGIGSVDVLAEAIVPAACDLNFALQVDGEWRKFDHDFSALDGGDPLIPFRVEISGTTDLMPGISLTNNEITLSKAPSPTLHHISDPVDLGTPTNSVKTIVKLHNYDPAHHSYNVSLHYGATHNVSGVDAEQINDDGTLVITTTFAVSSISSYQIEIDGTNDGVGGSFFASERITFAT